MIYLDHAAAMRPDEATFDFVRDLQQRFFANPEAIHAAGREVKHLQKEASERLAAALRVPVEKVIFTDSATMAFRLLAASPWVKGKNCVTTPLEHPALLAALADEAAKTAFLPVDCEGVVSRPATRGDGDVCWCHSVQSELGVHQDFDKLTADFSGLKVCDAVQAAGKLPLPENADVWIVSGRKFGAVSGAALLLNRNWPDAEKFARYAAEVRHPFYRTGRVDPVSALGLAFAAERAAARQNEEKERLTRVADFLTGAVTALPLPGGKSARRTVAKEHASPWILHFLFPGIESGVLLRMLSEKAVCVSAGSACSSETRRPSRTLTAIGVSKKEVWSGLRLSFGPDTTEKEAKIFLNELKTALKNY